ncbi:MAG: hypothetical protein WBG92_00695, partial [Thiohalocapsa sp.]
ITALVAVAVVTVATWLVMPLFGRLAGKQIAGFIRDMVTSLLGLVVLSMGFSLHSPEPIHSRSRIPCQSSSELPQR